MCFRRKTHRSKDTYLKFLEDTLEIKEAQFREREAYDNLRLGVLNLIISMIKTESTDTTLLAEALTLASEHVPQLLENPQLKEILVDGRPQILSSTV